jgi:NAD(P)-dependent dehydrogenase (short-subunit alcohol dehydrogenase family)
VAIADFTDNTLAELVSLRPRGAVVTGGARGIGAGVARRLAEAGASVLVTDVDGEGAARVAAQLPGGLEMGHRAMRVDITDTSALVAAADLAVEAFGRLDIWVNNAGIYPTTGPAIDAGDDFIDRMLTVNVRGTFAAAREAARRMTGGGVIVNLASTTGFHASKGISAYSTSKHAVVGLTKCLAVEFAPLGIRVVGVAPTVIDTPGVREQMDPLAKAGLDVEATMAANLLGRAGVADDVARVVLCAVSDLAAFVTGSTSPVDAGALAGR